LGSGCVPDNHPLSSSGNADILLDSGRALFAADVLDDNGNPVLPRQVPYEKLVQLYMTSASAPDLGAYVDVQLDPPDVLALVPFDDSCEQLAGVFRCTAGEDGFASLLVRSVSDWSGTVTIKLVGRTEQVSFTVSEAGLPVDATNFQMIIEGVDASVVPARYNALQCTFEPEPDNAFNKWPKGATRVREAEVRATPPSATPGVIEHAPVIIQTLHPEAFITLDPTCAPPRDSRLRVQLDALGRSPKFYFCFSDVGGSSVELAFHSGKLTGSPKLIAVEPEPRLLRIITTTAAASVLTGQQDFVALSAFDADLNKVSFTVDVTTDNPAVLDLTAPTAVLPQEGEDSELILATPLATGEAQITVTPELHSQPACSSETIIITE